MREMKKKKKFEETQMPDASFSRIQTAPLYNQILIFPSTVHHSIITHKHNNLHKFCA